MSSSFPYGGELTAQGGNERFFGRLFVWQSTGC